MNAQKMKLLRHKLGKVKQIKALHRIKYLISQEIEKESKELGELNHELAKLK